MDKIYSKSKDISYRKIDNELLIVPIGDKTIPEKPELFYLEDQTSIKIWELIDGKRELSQIIKEISELFSIEKDKIEDDVANFISELKNNGIIVEKH